MSALSRVLSSFSNDELNIVFNTRDVACTVFILQKQNWFNINSNQHKWCTQKFLVLNNHIHVHIKKISFQHLMVDLTLTLGQWDTDPNTQWPAAVCAWLPRPGCRGWAGPAPSGPQARPPPGTDRLPSEPACPSPPDCALPASSPDQTIILLACLKHITFSQV